MVGVLWNPPAVLAAEVWSVVVAGSMVDVPAMSTPAGQYLSGQGLVDVLIKAGGFQVETRSDRGHLAIHPGKGGTPPVLKGFTKRDLVIVTDSSTLPLKVELELGVPYLKLADFQSVLESLGFRVMSLPDSGLMQVIPPPPAASQPPPAVGSASSPALPVAGMDPAQLQKAAEEMLRGMGIPSPSSPSVARASSPNNAVCVAMDDLRQRWHETEPSQAEKIAFQEVARRLQAAKEQGGQPDAGDLDILAKNLKSFGTKVERRRQATRNWSAPVEAAKVKTLGVGFMDNYSEAMKICDTIMDAIERGDNSFLQSGQGEIERLKNINNTIQTQGMAFDQEVSRVRSTYGCGPATLGLPPS